MWILQWLPNWIFYACFLVGVLGLAATFVMKFIPFVYVYKTPLQIVSIILIAVGTYMAGAISNNEQWEARVKELQMKVAEAQAKAAEENVKIVEKVVNNTKIVKERGEEVIKYVEKEVIKYDTKFIAGGECAIPKEFILSLNKAATPPDAKK